MSSDAAQLRRYLLSEYSTDYGVSDDVLTAVAARARETVAQRQDGTGWMWEAGKDMRRDWLGLRDEQP